MKCPVDDSDLMMTDRQGIEIDYCPKCRGVWLDRGELDKLIERNGSVEARPRDTYQDNDRRQEYDRHDRREDYSRRHDDDDYHGYDQGHGHKKHKKEGFLGDLFDF